MPSDTNNRLFHTVFECSVDPILLLDNQRTMIDVNPSALDLFGYTRAEMIGQTTALIHFSEDMFVRFGRKIYPELQREGCCRIEWTFLRKDGSTVDTDVTVSPVPEKDGHPARFMAIIRDMTDRTETRAALAASEAKYRQLFNEMSVGFALHEIICNESGTPVDYRFLEVNPAFERLTGLKKENLVGRRIREMLPDTEPRWIDTYGHVALTGESVQFEEYSRELDRYFDVVSYCPEKGKFAVVFNDITVRCRAEQERQALIEEMEAKNAELERFTYTVSHDLKSPLITIKGFIGMLQQDIESGDTENIADDMAEITAAADRMNDLLEELLELSRIGRLVNPPEEVSLEELTGEATRMLQGAISEKNVTFTFMEDMPTIYVDRPRFVEVMQNLIENAVKYMGETSSPEIEVGALKLDGEVTCWVKDNGIGISPRYREKVFGLFEKLDQSSPGTGIGLAIVKRIIECHNGRIWVESAGEGTGSTFYFTIPDTEEAS